MQERLRSEEQRHRSELDAAEASKAQKERLEAELKGAEGDGPMVKKCQKHHETSSAAKRLQIWSMDAMDCKSLCIMPVWWFNHVDPYPSHFFQGTCV